jgi:hypothetical protein
MRRHEPRTTTVLSRRTLVLAVGTPCALTLLVAGAVAIAAPGWLDHSTRGAIETAVTTVTPAGLTGDAVELPDEPGLAVDIFFNNFVQAFLPLLGGWLAASRRGHRPLAVAVFLILPLAIAARSLFTVGAVGGADPAWLVDSSRWWLLEAAALGIGCTIGGRLALGRAPSADIRRLAALHGVAAIAVLLALAAIIEVFTA